MQSDYEMLYQKFVAGQTETIGSFVMSKTRPYLLSFCKANNIPTEKSGSSKERVKASILQWLAQKKAISHAPPRNTLDKATHVDRRD